ncbi:serine hydrolase domain-containing protein [Patulibacter defluvii]|uniref:serine hydrolase domain-containing protein n=1 Tax=Patulibacter defluvii TaxID=3095358 RepID=UPI002A7587C4|nr:serine hydrolase domain-containing protein [Patulibacter sp. DM4]
MPSPPDDLLAPRPTADPPPAVDRAALAAAVDLARSTEPALPRAMDRWLAATLADEPWPHVMGPLLDRGGPSGLVVVGGRVVARWGDPDRREMTFSIAKSALSLVAGLAFDDGLLVDLDEPAVARVPLAALGGTVAGGGLPLDPAAARRISWRQLLTQTSDWRGTLFDLPWWADPQGRQPPDEPAHGAGVRFAYNDVRTNLLSLALTHLHGRGAAEVLGERLLAPIGVADGWRWHGLDQMRTTLADGRRVPVVTGGSHWGGGLWLTASELALLGLLVLAGGRWGDDRLLSERWRALALEPCPLRPAYGLMWWRNPWAGRPRGSDAPPLGAVADHDAFHPGSGVRGFAAHGTGDQVVWCDPDRELVAVVRWTTDPNPVLAAITAAVSPRSGP